MGDASGHVEVESMVRDDGESEGAWKQRLNDAIGGWGGKIESWGELSKDIMTPGNLHCSRYGKDNPQGSLFCLSGAFLWDTT